MKALHFSPTTHADTLYAADFIPSDEAMRQLKVEREQQRQPMA